MADTFRFKVGDTIKAGSEEAQVLEVLDTKQPPAYRVKILSTEREMVIDARLARPLKTEE